MKSAIGLAVLAASVAAASGCGGNSSSSPLLTAPSAPLTTDTFSGTVPILGNDVHAFVASQSGEVDITLATAGPPTTIMMGLAVGTLASANSTTCLPVSSGTVSAQASTTPQLTGTLAAGAYCVMVFDIGNETEPVSYVVTVQHS